MRNSRVIAVIVLALVILAGVAVWRARDDGGGGEKTPPPGNPGGGAPDPRGNVRTPVRGKLPAVAFAIAPAIDDRFSAAPCNLVRGSGLWAFPAFRDGTASANPFTIALSMGDITRAPGEIGRKALIFALNEVMVEGGVHGVAAGPYELQHGVDFVRGALAEPARNVLGANVVDAAGGPILRGFALADAGGRTVLIVAAVDEGLQADLVARGSDVRLIPALDAIRTTVARAEAQAKDGGRDIALRVLLFHGTLEQSVALAREIPGFTFAVAARGGPLPNAEPVDAAGTQVFYAGREFRFGLRLRAGPDGELQSTLVRNGIQMNQLGNPIAELFDVQDDVMAKFAVPAEILPEDRRPPDARGEFLGSAACAACHAEIVTQHSASPHGRQTPALAATTALGRTACLSCHVTAPFNRTGWRGPADTSDLAGISCESCHGPASAHVAAPKEKYGAVQLAECRSCHTPERTIDFDPEALWKRHGHRLK